jgi:hypothetical protein
VKGRKREEGIQRKKGRKTGRKTEEEMGKMERKRGRKGNGGIQG